MNFGSGKKGLLGMLGAVLVTLAGCGSPQTVSPENAFVSMKPSNIDAIKVVRQTASQLIVNRALSNEEIDHNVHSIPVVQPGTTGDNALWLNEALSALHYLPLTFTPDEVTPASDTSALGLPLTTAAPAIGQLINASPLDTHPAATPTASDALLAVFAGQLKAGNLTPLTGTWTWNGDYPKSLVQLWDASKASVMTRGAVMEFENQHQLAVDGIAGPLVYQTLIAALQTNDRNKHPYVYVTVTKSKTVRIDVWEGDKAIFSSLANTGIESSPTPDGTWPIYLRFDSQTMQGTSPSGESYYDPDVPWVSYFYQGCAIHGFPRASYGWEQSLGCVELPISRAQKVYNLLDYGTLVTVNT